MVKRLLDDSSNVCVPRVSREAALDVNTEPSQSEQIVWDDPTAREERAKLADNLQWPGSPSQHSDPMVAAPPPTAEPAPQMKDSMTDSELVEMGLCRFQNLSAKMSVYDLIKVSLRSCLDLFSKRSRLIIIMPFVANI